MRTSSLIDFFGLKRGIFGLLVLVVLVGLGEHMGEQFVPIYLFALGGGELVVGIRQAFNNLLNALYSFPGGYLADRWGVRNSLLFFIFVAMAGFLIVSISAAKSAVILGSALFLSWSAVSQPAMMNYIFATLPPERRTMGVALNSLVRRIPKALGPVIGGIMIGEWGEQEGVRYAFLTAFVLTSLSLVVVVKLVEGKTLESESKPRERGALHPLRLFREMNSPLRNLLVSDILIRFCEQLPYAFVVVWCMKGIDQPVSAAEFGALTAIEMTTALLIYIPVGHFGDRFGKRPFVLATFVFFSLFPVALLMCQSFWPLAAAFVLRGLKEFGEPTRKALIVDLSPQDKRATMFGLYYLIRDTIVSIAPILGAALWIASPTASLICASAFGAIGTGWFALRGRDVVLSGTSAGTGKA